jgi:hypothetical protein
MPKGRTKAKLSSERKGLPKAGPHSPGYKGKKSDTRLGREPLGLGIGMDRAAQGAKEREEAAAVRQAAQEHQLILRNQQAIKALMLLPSTLSGLALRVATLLINAFPAVQTAGMTRTKAAEMKMREQLTPEELLRHGAIAKGAGCARTALTAAYEQLIADKAAA